MKNNRTNFVWLSLAISVVLSQSWATAELVRHDRERSEYAKRAREPQFRCVVRCTCEEALETYSEVALAFSLHGDGC